MDYTNDFERAGRWKKAKALADTLRAAGCTPEQCGQMTDKHWEVCCNAAKVKKLPSETTRALVVTMLKPMEGN